MTIFNAGNGWRDHDGEGPLDYLEKGDWIVYYRNGKYIAENEETGATRSFAKQESAKAFVEKQIEKRRKR